MNLRRTPWSALLFGLVVVFPPACGYRWAVTPDRTEAGRTLRVEPFANPTDETLAGDLFARDLRLEIGRRAHFHLITDEGEADSRMAGRILSVEWTPAGLDVAGRTRRYLLRVEAQVRWVDAFDRVLGQSRLTRTTEYNPASCAGVSPTMDETARREAIERLSGEMVREIYDDLMQDF